MTFISHLWNISFSFRLICTCLLLEVINFNLHEPWNLRFSTQDIPGSHRAANATGEVVATVLMLAVDALITRCLGIVPLSIAVCSCTMLISVFRISSFLLLGIVGLLVQIGLSLSIWKFLAKGWTVVQLARSLLNLLLEVLHV
jgi:hypothetical protein